MKKQDKRDWKTLDELFEFQSSVWEILVANDRNVTNWQEHKLVCKCPFNVHFKIKILGDKYLF